MSHVRQRIREAVATAITNLPTASERVYQSLVYPVDVANLPCLVVYVRSETSEIDSITRPRGVMRFCTLIIEGKARAIEDIDDTLDTIAKEVEGALGSSTLSSLVLDLRLSSTEIEINNEAKQPTGTVRMEWIAQYRTIENDAETTR